MKMDIQGRLTQSFINIVDFIYVQKNDNHDMALSKPQLRSDVEAYLKAQVGPGIENFDPKTVRQPELQTDLPVGEIFTRDVFMLHEGRTIGMRIYDQRKERGPSKVMVFYHGGGWVICNVDTHDPVCAEIARHLDLPVISVEYRLAPEHPWPAAPDDCEAAVRWISSAPSELGLTPSGLVLAGDSAGGNLAIVTMLALRLRTADLPVLAQWVIYPVTNLDGPYPWAKRYESGFFLTAAAMDWFKGHYQADTSNWRASPIKADLKGLPPALVTLAEFDPLVDQGYDYFVKLRDAGVDAELHVVPNIHSFINSRKAIPSSADDFNESLNKLKVIVGN